ncbi:TolC family protein [Dysgonomonas sp.]|jgi:outer membrane protein TolC|uniref:TolC family protein n=1 Tax=Dysgonomonas sp. TaxID=1891233 RepID=UPI0028214524|nr:TolC family protein [Dysgonomonas sp.]MDR2001697.1 TolC family protein [Prevotella sp.]HMM04277.1 TolC family protein [Dysgonomonas sp.]
MKKTLSTIAISLWLSAGLTAQDTIAISLTDAINRSVSNSVDAVVARNQYKSSYWGYRTYKAELLPEVTLNSTLPYYSKSYNQFQNTDGTYTYVSNDYSRIDGGLSISQNIPLTGGILSVESSFERLQQYGEGGSTRYMGIPASVTLEQPIFGFNRVKWLQRIEPVKYKEAQQKLIGDMEEVSNTAIQYYFNLLLGQINMEIAQQNLKNSEKLYTIAEARRKIGQISENDLLQLKVSLLKAESYLTDAQASLNARMFQLRSFLNYGEDLILKPIIPESLASELPVLSYAQVIALARENNSFTRNIQKRMLEANRDVSQAKADRWNAKLFVSFGMSGQEDTFSRAFNSNNWRNNQIVNVGIKIPILDWGKGKGKVKIAEAERDVENSRIEKEQMDFNQNVFLRVQNFNSQSKQLELAKETDKIAQQRYNTSIEAFVLGKIDVLNLNDSQSSKDEARRNYIEQMYQLWSYYYQLRSLTLYDFISDREISVDYESATK